MDNFQDLAALMNGREITDDSGQIKGEEPTEETAPQEDEEVTTPEPEVEEEAPQAEPEAEDVDVEDESGKKYVPEDRFKKVYGQAKAAEREKKALEEQLRQLQASKSQSPAKIDKTAMIETELLFTQMPQFNPSSEDYSPELDKVAGSIYATAKGSITKLEAARQAIDIAKRLQSKVTSIKTEAKILKRTASEGNLATKIGQRTEPEKSVDKMDLEEMEQYMKANKAW